jgi:hypothetical protein
VEDGGDVVGPVELPYFNQPRQQRIDIVVVRLGTAKFGGEWSECREIDGAVGLASGESGAADIDLDEPAKLGKLVTTRWLPQTPNQYADKTALT